MKILITGANGLVGYGFWELAKNDPEKYILAGRSQIKHAGKINAGYDLTSPLATDQLFREYKPTHVIHLAAKVGGVQANMNQSAEFFHENIMINTNVLESSHAHKVEKVVSFLSTCVYPDNAVYPLTENQIHAGYPHSSNFSYAFAKRMADIQSRAYRKQHGSNFVTVVPNNLYGPNDYFDLENSHVIPALIRKIYEAKNTDNSKVSSGVSVWGDGSPLREFTFAPDMADILLYILENYSGEEPINIGNTAEYSISDVVRLICSMLDYEGSIFWDTSKPLGQLRKPSSNQKFLDLGWNLENYTTLEEGIRITCSWFEKNYPNIRGA
jgi:GDP-L-fucose synthase